MPEYFFGLVSFVFIETLKQTEKLADKIKIWAPLKGLIGGGLLILLALVFSTDYLGLGIPTINKALNGENIIIYAFIIKMIATAITLGFGGSGGVLTPIFFIGATSGIAFASIAGLNQAQFAAFGVVGVLAGAANTPLAACILAVELFGPTLAPYATITCIISFLMTGYRSIFPSQVLSSQKSQSLIVTTGDEVEDGKTRYEYKTKKIMASSRYYKKSFKAQIKKLIIFKMKQQNTIYNSI